MNVEANNKADGGVQLDEELYSRQLYVIGHDSMKKLMSSKILIIGLDGLGQEIAKNICLAGVKSLSLYDKSPVTIHSLCSGFFFKESCLGKDRDISVQPELKKLNKYVYVDVIENLDPSLYDIVVSVNQKLEDNIKMDEYCHKSNIKFIMANLSGLFSQIFCDFQSHTCVDKNGENISMGSINDITTEGILTLADGSKHNMEDGDYIKIRQENFDPNQIYKISIISKNKIKLIDTPPFKSISVGGDFEQVKMPFLLKFKDLETALNNPKITNFDFSTNDFVHRLFCGSMKDDCLKNIKEEDEFIKIKEQFEKTKGCLISPMCSILGGFAAQEVIKAATGQFLPVDQFFYFNASNAYMGDSICDSNSRYFDMMKIFGKNGFEILKKAKIFLVGAGAIGCENLKNFICCGLGLNGRITVTDMDSIEQSNLNRQFLFREDDVSKMKSESAILRAKTMNEDYSTMGNDNLKSYNIAVNGSTEDIFTDLFIEDQDLISNALDNVEARVYMDQRCIKMRKPMVDAGTLGAKGHVQVVAPFYSESYSSSSDPVEKSIPLCTIKSYPYSIEHTIEWALSEFNILFNENIQALQEYVKNDKLDEEEMKERFDNAPRNVEDCIKIALASFVEYFSTSIQKLLDLFPSDHINEDGMPFWSPPKRVPSPVSFNINDQMHICFVKNYSNLLAESHGIRKISTDEVYAFLENILSLKEPNPISFGNSSVDLSNLHPLDFEKDSWHADFIYACANLRARNYGIKESTKHQIIGIAGKIIPAIATTTAIVSGLAVLEIIKYLIFKDRVRSDQDNVNILTDESNLKINDNDAELLRNSYLDLTIPFLAQTDLVKPLKLYIELPNGKFEYNLWSRLDIKNDILRNVKKEIEEKLGVGIGMISIHGKIVFWDACKKYDGNLDKMISKLCTVKKHQKMIFLDALSEDDRDLIDIAVILDN